MMNFLIAILSQQIREEINLLRIFIFLNLPQTTWSFCRMIRKYKMFFQVFSAKTIFQYKMKFYNTSKKF